MLVDLPPTVIDALVEEWIETVPCVLEHRLLGVKHVTMGKEML